MESLLHSSVTVGDRLPVCSRQYRLADFVQGTEKTIHTDVEAARAEGLPGPVAIGPQVAGLLFTVLRQAFGPSWVAGSNATLSFRRPIPVESFCSASGIVTDVQPTDGGVRVCCDVWVKDAAGTSVIAGTASAILAV